MARQGVASMLALALVIGVFAAIPSAVQSIGVCYGQIGDNLPSPSDVVQLYKSNGINAMRIYFPDAATLQALRGTGIALILDVGNDKLGELTSDPSAAATWVQNNIQAYPDVSFRYIVAGNEVNGDAQNILPAIQNLDKALSAAGFNNIKLSTAVSQGVITGFPPSAGTFSASYMPQIVQYLATTGAPLLANVYPYFSYRDNQANIKLDYVLFTLSGTVVQDGSNGYQNLFDAVVDTFYSALENANAGAVGIVVSESGWPSAGGIDATPDNARTYNQNLVNHVGRGTPKRPGAMEAYIFAMFNENQKQGKERERHFGLFNPDKSPVYLISFVRDIFRCLNIYIYNKSNVL